MPLPDFSSMTPEQILALKRRIEQTAKEDPTIAKAVNYSKRRNYRDQKKEELFEKYPVLREEEARKKDERIKRRDARLAAIAEEKERRRKRREDRRAQREKLAEQNVQKSQQTTNLLDEANVSEELRPFFKKAMIAKRLNGVKVTAFKVILTTKENGKYDSSDSVIEVTKSEDDAYTKAKEVILNMIQKKVESFKTLETK